MNDLIYLRIIQLLCMMKLLIVPSMIILSTIILYETNEYKQLNVWQWILIENITFSITLIYGSILWIKKKLHKISYCLIIILNIIMILIGSIILYNGIVEKKLHNLFLILYFMNSIYIIVFSWFIYTFIDIIN